MEVWKDIEGYEGLYEVSNLGRVKSLPRIVKNRYGYRTTPEKILAPLVSVYQTVALNNCGTKISSIHRIVAKTFIPNPLNKSCVNHIDCNPLNNNVSNLEWVTYLENQMHSRRLGRYKESDKKSSERMKIRMNKNG